MNALGGLVGGELLINDQRYRWLRNGGWEVLQDPKYWPAGVRFDEAIDAAMVSVAVDAALAKVCAP